MKLIDWLKSIEQSNNLALTLVGEDGNTTKNLEMFTNLINSIKDTCVSVLNHLPESSPMDEAIVENYRRRATAGFSMNTPAPQNLSTAVLNTTKLDHISAEVSEIKEKMALNEDLKILLQEIRETQKTSKSEQIKYEIIEHINTCFSTLKCHIDEQISINKIEEDKDVLSTKTHIMSKYVKETSERILETLEGLKEATKDNDEFEQISQHLEESMTDLTGIVKLKEEEEKRSIENYLESVEELMRKVSRINENIQNAFRILNNKTQITRSVRNKTQQTTTFTQFEMLKPVPKSISIPDFEPPILLSHPKFSENVPLELIIQKELEEKTSIIYIGSFENSKRNGFGALIYKNGAIYQGEWRDNLAHGKGTMIYSTGARYEGEWYQSRWNGYGKLTYPNGDYYIGNFKNGVRNGNGYFNYCESGNTYDGMWVGDKENGKGELKWANGDKFVGLFKDGQMDGEGVMTFADGNVKEGNWVKGIFQE